ncbi:MAG: alkaline phosphatase family protein [Candidatus Limnocylindrales bacterium]
MDGPYRARDRRVRVGVTAVAAAVVLVVGGLWLLGPTHLPGIAAPTRVGVASLPSSAFNTGPSAGSGTPSARRSSHVWLIMLENKESSSLLGNTEAPYFNGLVATYGLATNYYATGHPSQPNYVALVAGSVAGVTADGKYHLSRGNLFSQLDAAGLPWREYAQDVPGVCFTGASGGGGPDGTGAPGTYARKHNPAISFTSVADNPVQCSDIQPLADFNPGAGTYELIVPNLINDMHNGTIGQGDAFLAAFVPQITGSPEFAAGGVLFITFDEGSTKEGQLGDDGGHVATLLIAASIPAGYDYAPYADHSSVLRTTESLLGLPCLGLACQRTPIGW